MVPFLKVRRPELSGGARKLTLPKERAPTPPPPRVDNDLYHEWYYFKWTGSSKDAVIRYSPRAEKVVYVTDVYRGNHPPGTAGQMLADTLKYQWIKPSVIRLHNIINKEVKEALDRGVPPSETRLGGTVQRAAIELGGKARNWSHGVEEDKMWMQAEIEYD